MGIFIFASLAVLLMGGTTLAIIVVILASAVRRGNIQNPLSGCTLADDLWNAARNQNIGLVIREEAEKLRHTLEHQNSRPRQQDC